MSLNSLESWKLKSFDSYHVSKNKVPNWFVQWYELLEKNNHDLIKVLDYYLWENELKNAIEVFQKETSENIEKVWH